MFLYGNGSLSDMAVQNFVGDALRGATWVALHNGGGVGWCDLLKYPIRNGENRYLWFIVYVSFLPLGAK